MDLLEQKFHMMLNHSQVTVQIYCFDQLKSFQIIQMTYLCNLEQ